MKHAFLDQYSDGTSFIHNLDPRTKLITTLLFLVAVVLTPAGSWPVFGVYLIFPVAVLLMSHVPAGFVLKRSMTIMPFILLVAIFIPFFKEGQAAGSYNIWLWHIKVSYAGLQILINVLIKSWLSILSLTLLTATTPVPLLLKSMGRLHFPGVMVTILSFMYRYIFILIDEVMRMKQARDSRSFGAVNRTRLIRSAGNMIGTLFIRSYERGERAYAAMASRGFDGNTRSLNQLKFKGVDAIFGLTAVFAIAAVTVFGFIYQGLL